MSEFEKADKDGNGSVDKSEWDALLLDDKRMQIEDENSKRDQQRKMVWFSLAGLLLYPVMIIICNLLPSLVLLILRRRMTTNVRTKLNRSSS
jgi:hypothetical protein